MIVFKKRGQFWYMDFIMALIVMAVIGSIFIKTVIGMSQTNDILDEVLIEAQEISNLLVSEGYPTDWETQSLNNIYQIGLTTGDLKISGAKLDAAMNMNYVDSKVRLGANNEYYFFINDGTNIIKRNGQEGGGKFSSTGEDNGLNTVAEIRTLVSSKVSTGEIQDLIEVNRLVFLPQSDFSANGGKIYRLTVLVWSES